MIFNNNSCLVHKFKMRCNEIVVKKIDLRERVNLHANNRPLKVSHTTFPLHKKVRHPSFQTMRTNSPQKVYSNLYTDVEDREGVWQQRSETSMSPQHSRNKFSRQEDKTYNNNYKLFPKRSFLRSSYIVENSNIIIDIFSKKIEFQERKNDFLAKSLSLQLRNCSEKIFGQEKPASKQATATSRQRISRQSLRASSARQANKPRYEKIERFTPWEVQNVELQDPIADHQ